jgi:hypothetical protein
METKTKATPESLADLAQALLELANHVERVTDVPEAAIVDRMLAEGADKYQAAFHGLLYAWIIAVMPELEPVLGLDVRDYRRTVVLENRIGSGWGKHHNRFEFMLPKALDYIDDE